MREVALYFEWDGASPAIPPVLPRKEAWPLYKTISGVRLCLELEESKGPKGLYPQMSVWCHAQIVSHRGTSLIRRRTPLVGSGKDIGKDKPAFGWELEPFVAFGSISGNVPWGKDKTRKGCERTRWPCGLGSSYP